MAGNVDSPSPLYISPQSAHTILSDVRPIKLNAEALHSINVFLDEILYSILNAAKSLSTDKLRASLLTLLPTTLGKEALLEAEVELRAYWEKTAQADITREDDSSTFHLQWAFEILRLKCEAYSTLNEVDEDHEAEARMNYKMTMSGGVQPKAALVAPASLYLTAILEAICEHVLSSIGRVVARDSSRTSATMQDLFVALCEDNTIYDLFKTMKVYEQIEHLSKGPRVRRSKSLTRNDKSSRTSSPHHDSSTNKDVSTRGGADAATNGVSIAGTAPGSRSSIEKSRAIKMFKVNSRPSLDRDADVANGHKKTDSFVSENSRHTSQTIDGQLMIEDEVLQQEFDDLMRSSSTMKVSLTPDRLKSMEVYKQERGNRKKPGPLSFKSNADSSVLPPRASGRDSSLLRVDSIKEDEEEPTVNHPQSAITRSRQSSVTSPLTPPAGINRIRSLSTSSSRAASRAFAKITQSTSPPPSSMQTRQYAGNQGLDSFPPRTRKLQRKRESMDLDDVMDGSDNEAMPPQVPDKPATPVRRRGQHHVSAGTKELMDFLAQGPPDVGPQMINTNNGSLDATKSKSAGRLQRMISKLHLSNAERSRGADDPSGLKMPPPSIHNPGFSQKSSSGNLSSLANRPVPPRPPRLISPPASPHDSSDEQSHKATPRSRGASASQVQPPLEVRPSEVALGSLPREHHGNGFSNQPHLTHAIKRPNGAADHILPVSPPPRTVSIQADLSPTNVNERRKSTLPSSPTRKPVPPLVEPNDERHISASDALDLRRLISKADTADECRLILDSFLAKSGVLKEALTYDVPYPSPSPSLVARKQHKYDQEELEAAMVELFLGSEAMFDSSPPKRRPGRRSKPKVEAEQPPSPQANGTIDDEASVEDDHLHSANGNMEGSEDVAKHTELRQNYTTVES